MDRRCNADSLRMVVSEHWSGPDGFKRTREPLTAAAPAGVVALEVHPETGWASAAETSRAVAYHRVFQLIFRNLILIIILPPAIEDAGKRMSEMIKKFDNLKKYKVVHFDGSTKITDIEK